MSPCREHIKKESNKSAGETRAAGGVSEPGSKKRKKKRRKEEEEIARRAPIVRRTMRRSRRPPRQRKRKGTRRSLLITGGRRDGRGSPTLYAIIIHYAASLSRQCASPSAEEEVSAYTSYGRTAKRDARFSRIALNCKSLGGARRPAGRPDRGLRDTSIETAARRLKNSQKPARNFA